MPALHDLPPAIRRTGLWPFLKKLWFEINDDNLFTWAAALAYSWLFAIFPFFLLLLSLIPLLRPEWKLEAHNQIDIALKQLPRDAQITLRQYVEPKLRQLINEPPRGITTIWSISLLVTIFAASGGMNMTMNAMDRAYDVPRSRPIYKQRPLAIMLTLVVAALILAVVILIPIGTILTNYLTTRTNRILIETGLTEAATNPSLDPQEVSATAPTTAATTQSLLENPVQRPGTFFAFIILWQIFRYGLGALFMFWVVALVYHFGPNVKQRFRLLSPGSVFTVATWVLLGVTFRFYVDTYGKYGQMYGAVGGVVILLFFFYLDALVLLIGAEINAEVDCALREESGSPNRVPLAETKDTKPAPETP